MSKKHSDWVDPYAMMQKINTEAREKNLKNNYAQARPKIHRYKLSNKFSSAGFFILIFSYPLYGLIRFILWAIKIPRGSK